MSVKTMARFSVRSEAGRGSLAGPLLVAGVLLDYEALRGSRVRPLALLNDSKQLTGPQREELFQAVVGCAERISVHIKNSIGVTAKVKAVAPDTLERSLGKAKRVYDKRPKG